MVVNLLRIASGLLVQVMPCLFVVQQVHHWRLLLFLGDLAQHVVDQPLLLVAVALAARRRREAQLGRLQHAVPALLHLPPARGQHNTTHLSTGAHGGNSGNALLTVEKCIDTVQLLNDFNLEM